MPALTVGAITGLSVNEGPMQPVEIGERARAFNGVLRTSVRARKRRWTFSTTPLTTSDTNALYAALIAAPPITCSGDILGGSVSCGAEVMGREPTLALPGRWIVTFALYEV